MTDEQPSQRTSEAPSVVQRHPVGVAVGAGAAGLIVGAILTALLLPLAWGPPPGPFGMPPPPPPPPAWAIPPGWGPPPPGPGLAPPPQPGHASLPEPGGPPSAPAPGTPAPGTGR
ncbi:hypothetical protein [Mycobacterium sp. IS-1264]|uniref:hypothetical protein n=1 Tax=Mycobacterium sp. IS-1264 TaxID=1834158 RepID=UPI00096BE268|nr:hypothetical protein [Mycobacterium sp. IS-1264]OMC46785.1 hypothetical protein A5744_07970 [Mycobacterium sp. IS-1264]